MVIVGCHRNLYDANTWWSTTSTSLISLSSHFCACMHICVRAQRHLKMKSFKNNKSSHRKPLPFVFCSVVGNLNESDGGRVGGAEQEYLICKSQVKHDWVWSPNGWETLHPPWDFSGFKSCADSTKVPRVYAHAKRSCHYVTVPVVHISELGGW